MSRAIFDIRPIGDELAPASLTGLRSTPDRVVPTLPAAILDDAKRRLAGIELDSTMGTSDIATGIADKRRARAGLKLLPATVAVAKWNAIREVTGVNQFGVFLPEQHVGLGVTCRTESDQILNNVRLSVICEQMKRALVMHRQVFASDTAYLAGIVVALSRDPALPIPVVAPVFCVPSKPGWIVSAAPVSRCTPNGQASRTAEVVALNRTRPSLNRFAACVAIHRNALAAITTPINPLPFSVAPRATEMVLRDSGHVGFGIIGTAALFARQGNHTVIIR